MLRSQTEVVGDAVVVTLAGVLQRGRDADVLRELVDRLVLRGVCRLVIDCGKVERIDAAGVGTLVYAQSRIGLARGRVALLNPTARVRRVLDVCGLSGLFATDGPGTEALVEGTATPANALRKPVSVGCGTSAS